MSFPIDLQFAEVAAFDESTFDQAGWELSEWRDQKTRHIALHIAKLPLKIIEDDADRIVDEVIPDMALYRTQLVQAHELDIEVNDILIDLQFPMYIDSWRKPALEKELRRVGGQEFALKRAAIAGGWLAKYLEPREHNEEVSSEQRQMFVLDAASNLHIGAVALSKEFHVDLQTKLLQRMASQTRSLSDI